MFEGGDKSLVQRRPRIEIVARIDNAADGEDRNQGGDDGEYRHPLRIPGLEAHRAAQPDAAVYPEHEQQKELPRNADIKR